MKIFRLVADMKFEASNLDSAFLTLAQHLIELANPDVEDTTLEYTGQVRLQPVEE